MFKISDKYICRRAKKSWEFLLGNFVFLASYNERKKKKEFLIKTQLKDFKTLYSLIDCKYRRINITNIKNFS